MIASTPIRSVYRVAIGLLVVLVLGSRMLVDGSFSQGVLMGGLAMLGSFSLGGWLIRRASTSAHRGAAGAALLMMLKLPLLGIVLWQLLTHFDVLGVVLGGSIVTASVLIQALRDSRSPVLGEA